MLNNSNDNINEEIKEKIIKQKEKNGMENNKNFNENINDKKILRYKIKLLVYLILKSKYDKLMKINEKKEKVVIKQPVTPPPQSLIKILKSIN